MEIIKLTTGQFIEEISSKPILRVYKNFFPHLFRLVSSVGKLFFLREGNAYLLEGEPLYLDGIMKEELNSQLEEAGIEIFPGNLSATLEGNPALHFFGKTPLNPWIQELDLIKGEKRFAHWIEEKSLICNCVVDQHANFTFIQRVEGRMGEAVKNVTSHFGAGEFIGEQTNSELLELVGNSLKDLILASLINWEIEKDLSFVVPEY